MKKPLLVALILLLCFAFVYADEPSSSMSIATDFTIWPNNSPVYGEDSIHFSPITGIYKALELRSTFSYDYKIPVPFSDNPLVSGNNVKLVGSIEATPVSIALEPSVEFTPIAFLVFSSGVKLGTGWKIIGIDGLSNYNDSTREYTPATPFGDWYFRFWMQGLFQFDLAAVMPGDWNHVVTQASYQVMYTANTSVNAKDVWCWQASYNLVNGWEYYSSVVLGYQMPLMLQMVGVQFEFGGYYSADDIKAQYNTFKNDFMTAQVNPLAIIKFNEHHSLTVMFNFSNRRGFQSAPVGNQTDVDLTYSSDEWYFKRFALRYTYNF